jgi:hypothetical protein
MSLKSIRLRNFRSFLDTGRIELRPIVVLLGANNSGKSSLLRFFPLLRQTIETRASAPLLWYGNDVDFGDFAQALCHKAEERTIVVELEMYDSAATNGAAEIRTRSVIAEHEGTTHITSFEIESGGARATMDFAPDGTIARLSPGPFSDTPSPRSAPSAPAAEHPSSMGIANYGIGPGLIPDVMDLAWSQKSLEDPGAAQLDRLDGLRKLCWRGNRLQTVFAAAMRYIGPARREPQRFYRIQQLAATRIQPGGDNLAAYLHKMSENDQGTLARWIEEQFGFRLFFELQGGHVVLAIEEGGRRFNLVDTGYGFSQLLPIAVQCWAAASGYDERMSAIDFSFIALEQPELHLHPRYQARLADMFAGLINVRHEPQPWGPRLFVETHSEAMLERLGALVEAGKLRREDVLVLLVERDPDTGVSTVRQSEFDEQGTLKNWPIGFFAA